MPLDESTKKLLKSQGFSQDSSGKYNYSGGSAKKTSSGSSGSSSSRGSTGNYSDMSNEDIAQSLANYSKTSLLPSTNYLDRLSLYSKDANAGNTEIDRAGQVYAQKKALGDLSGAEAAHAWANQIRDAMGMKAGLDYDSVTGGKMDSSSLLPQQTNIEKIQDLMLQLPKLTKKLPEYNPYKYEEFEFNAPNYSITKDASGTSFLPTASAKNRWLQEQQAKADQKYKSYTADADNWKNTYQVNADQIANMLSLLPYDTLTAAQQATIDQAKASAKAAAAQAQLEAERWAAEFDLEKRKTDYATGKPYYDPTSGNTSPKPTTADYVSAIVSAQDQYKTPSDYKADLIRNKATIISLVGGMSNYNALLNDAQAQIEAGNKINANFEAGKTYGSSGETSPLTYALSSFSNPTSGSSGSVDSWVSTAMKSSGVGSDWEEPLKWIISKESSNNPTAINPSSGAYGLMQFLPQTWKNYGYTKTSDPTQQIEAGIDYIKARYGTAENAKSFWQKNGWY